jgi:hypothetical protein
MSILAPTASWAEMIEVRSGEHVDFSRIVMQFADAADWHVGRNENGYVFSTTAPSTSYDIQEVFKYIPRTRISDLISLPNGQLEIQTAAGFHADAFELRAGRIVIDIKDGPAPNNSIFETLLPTTNTDPLPQSSEATVVGEQNQALFSEQGTPSFSSIQSDELAKINSEAINFTSPNKPEPTNNSTYFSADLDPLLQNKLNVSDLERALIEQLGRAASQGLLDVNIPAPVAAEDYTADTRVVETAPDLPSSPTENSSHILIQTSKDRDTPIIERAPSVNSDGVACFSQSSLDIAQWGAPIEEGILLSTLRGASIGEFDQPVESGVKDLAKYYLYLTFGAEAKVALSEFGLFVRRANSLIAISDIMDFGYSKTPSPLDGQLECGGALAFWAAMSQEKFDKGTDYPNQEIANYFSGLPLHLRRHLGPFLSERFLEVGNQSAAQMIQGAISRVAGEHGDAFDLLQAEMALSGGEFEVALKAYEILANTDGPLAPDALISAIRLRASQDLPIDTRTAEFAEILAIEHKGTDQEKPLESAAVLARIHAGTPHIALQTLLGATELEDRSELIEEALNRISSNAEDITFARSAASTTQSGDHKNLPDGLKRLVAERLSEIGFNQLAREYIESTLQTTEQSQIRLAKISTAQGHHKEALGYLLGLEGSEASALRAEILMRLKRPDLAADEFRAIKDLTGTDNAEFMAENWDALGESKSEVMSSVATLLLNEDAPAPSTTDKQPTLLELSKLLERSKDARETFGELLE